MPPQTVRSIRKEGTRRSWRADPPVPVVIHMVIPGVVAHGNASMVQGSTALPSLILQKWLDSETLLTLPSALIAQSTFQHYGVKRDLSPIPKHRQASTAETTAG